MNGKLQFTLVRDFGLCSGDIANLYLGKVGLDTPVLVKVARNEFDNDLLKSEGEVLKDLVPKLKDSWSYFVPQILDSFKTDSDGVWCNILEFFPGFLDVESIRRLSTGVDGRTLVWMYKRLLGLLSWVHKYKIIHGAILPPHIMYFPDGSIKDERTHTVRVIDWAYAIDYTKTHKLSAWVPDYKDFYPDEVLNKKSIEPSSDLYMAAKTMLYLCGGNVAANKFPSRIPAQLARCICKCLESNPRRRPQTAGEHYDELKDVAVSVYGKPKFHEFNLII